MCIKHDADLLKKWLSKKPFKAYKIICRNNTSMYDHSFTWTVDSICCHVQKLQYPAREYPLYRDYKKKTTPTLTGRGLYICLDRGSAIKIKEWCEFNDCKVKMICVYINPEDVFYAGYVNTSYRTFVCRRVEVKSLRGLK